MFSFGQRLGLLFTVQASFVTAACNTGILVYVVFKRMKRARRNKFVPSDASDSSLFLNLMIADLVQAIGNFPSIRWISDAGITEGPLCNAQAVLKTMGGDTVAFTCLAISLQTFFTLITRWHIRRMTLKFIIVGIWMSASLITGITYAAGGKDQLYGASNYWCWVRNGGNHKTAQIMSEYLYIWITAISMSVLYGVMFLILHGYIVVDGRIHWYKSRNRVALDLWGNETAEDREVKKVAKMLLFYPAVYIVCVGPLSITRWLYFSGYIISYKVSLFASTLYALTGLFNLILFSITRPALVVGEPLIANSEIAATPLTSGQRSHGSHRHLPNVASGSDVEHGRPTGVDLEVISNGTSSSPVSAPGGLVPRQGAVNPGNEITYWNHDTQFFSSLAADHGRSAQEDCDHYLDYTSPIDEGQDYGRLPG